MKKTVLLAVVPLILIIIGCSKSDTPSTNTNCTFEEIFSGGKVFRPSFWVHYRNSINIDQKYYSKTDSNLTTFQFNGNGQGIARIKYFTSQFNLDSMRWMTTYKDTSVAMSYVVNSTDKKLSISYYSPITKATTGGAEAIDSFTCKTFRIREVETSGSKIDEYYTTFVND